MASSSTSESDSSLPVSSACKAQRWYESQSRQLNNEGEKFLPQCQSQYKIASYGPAQYQHPPFNIPRSAPAACRPRLPLTHQILNNFPAGCPPSQKKLCTALEWVVTSALRDFQVCEKVMGTCTAQYKRIFWGCLAAFLVWYFCNAFPCH